MSQRSLLLLLVPLLLAPAVRPAQAAAADGERVFAIQNRLFDKDHELALFAGFIPDMDFQHAYPVGLAYTFHLDERLAWEVVRGQWTFNQEKDLKGQLEDEFGATPEEFDRIRYTLHSNLVFKPSYGKDSLWNQVVVNHETYVLLGGGATNYERETSQGELSYETALSAMVGLGRKYFINRSFSVNFEVRDLVNFKDGGIENNVYLGVALAFRFNLKPRQAEPDAEVERFKKYLENPDD